MAAAKTKVLLLLKKGQVAQHHVRHLSLVRLVTIFTFTSFSGLNILSIVLQGASLNAEHKYKLVVVGGGAGGCGTANKFVGKFGKGEVCVIGNNQNLSIQFRWLALKSPPLGPKWGRWAKKLGCAPDPPIPADCLSFFAHLPH